MVDHDGAWWWWWWAWLGLLTALGGACGMLLARPLSTVSSITWWRQHPALLPAATTPPSASQARPRRRRGRAHRAPTPVPPPGSAADLCEEVACSAAAPKRRRRRRRRKQQPIGVTTTGAVVVTEQKEGGHDQNSKTRTKAKKQKNRKRPCAPRAESLQELPAEVLLGIFRLLGMSDLAAMAQVSTHMAALSDDDSLWRLLYARAWGRGMGANALFAHPATHSHTRPISYASVTPRDAGGESWKGRAKESLRVWTNWRRGDYGEEKLMGHRSSIYALQLARSGSSSGGDGDMLISASADGLIKVWDLESMKAIATEENHRAGINSLSLHQGCLGSASASDGFIHLWNFTHPTRSSSSSSSSPPPDAGPILRQVRTLYHPGVYSIQLDAQLDCVMTGSSSDADVKVWSLRTGQESTTLRGHKAGLCALQFDEQRLVTASEDRTVRLWDCRSERELHTFYGHKAWVRCLHLTHDSLWSGSSDKTAIRWDMRSREAVRVLDGHDTVRCLQVDDYKVVVGHWDGVIQTYDVRTYEPFEVLKYRNILYCMQMDHCRLFTGSHDATVQVWNFKDLDEDSYM